MAVAVGQASNRIERLTRCPICLDKFRIPKVLPCMHTFCLTPCLTNLVDPRARSLRCPECRREHAIPKGGVQAFPSNTTVNRSLDLQTSTSTVIDLPDRCFRCKAQKQILVNCEDCSKFFCTDCRESHIRETLFDINPSVNDARRIMPMLSNKIVACQKRINEVKTNYEQIRQEISSTIANLIDELKNRENALLTEAEGHMQSQLRTFRTQQETTEAELASVTGFCESVGNGFSNGPFISDADLITIRAQANHYSQQCAALQSQILPDVQKLRLIFNDPAVISSAIQNYGRLIDPSQQQQQPQYSNAPYSRTARPPATAPRNTPNRLVRSQNDYYRNSDNSYDYPGPTELQVPVLSQTLPSRSMQTNTPRNSTHQNGDLNSTVPNRTNTRSYAASWDPQTSRRPVSMAQSSSVFGSNPFSRRNSQQGYQSLAVPSSAPPEPLPRLNYTINGSAARSLHGDDRPIFGGNGGSNYGRGRAHTLLTIPEQAPVRNNLQRHGTFILDQPSIPNLPQSGAQRPRDKINVEDLYNVRRKRRAKTPIAFTIDLNDQVEPSADIGD